MKIKNTQNPLLILTIFMITIVSSSQSNKVLGGICDGCEALLEYGNTPLSPIDTLPLFETSRQKLKITGTVYHHDKKTLAKDIILYIYQTNQNGVYPTKGDEKGWAKRHGYIRGWVKTEENGKYTFYTFRPGAYPGRNEPEHIHITVKEPNKLEYYLDDFVFIDDPMLTKEKIASFKNRGGSGIKKPTITDGILTINRDLILGQNIPNYK